MNTANSPLLAVTVVLLGVASISAALAQGDASTALLSQGRSDEAMRALETQVGTNPFDPVSMNNLAAVKATKQDWNAASALLVRAHRLAPTNAIIARNLDQLNAWLARSVPTAGSAKATDNDRLNELAQIPPEPPELWSAPAASAGRAQTKQ